MKLKKMFPTFSNPSLFQQFSPNFVNAATNQNLNTILGFL